MTAPVLADTGMLSRDNTLLILIDLQEGALGTVGSMNPRELRANAVGLAKVARTLALPVLLAGAAIPGEAGVFLPEVRDLFPDAPFVSHSTNNSWLTPEFAAAVRQAERPNLVMAGLATDVGLALTALSAVKEGYRVYALVDVSGTLNSRIEQAAWIRMAYGGVTLTSWTAFTGEIQRDYTQEPGRELRAIIGAVLQSKQGPFAAGNS